MKIVTVLGARPQFIKAAVLSQHFGQLKDLQEIIVHTGQHYDINMSDIFFEEMRIPRPSYHLEVVSKHHGEMTGKMLIEVEKVLLKECPDILLVYGDTNSTLAGALAASKLHVPVAHVEAGLRSFNKQMPEEINRVLTDHMSDYLFTPTRTAVDNLIREGFDQTKIFPTGDIMFDGVLFYKTLAQEKSNIINRLGLEHKPFLLATIHRQENTNDPKRLNSLFDQLLALSSKKTIVLPLHPRTKSFLKKNFANSNFLIIEPVGYFDMLLLQQHCRLIATDSGGIQKESFFHKKFCLTLRDETEWTELTENKVNFLVNPLESLSDLVEKLWDKPFPEINLELYGDGHAAEKIANMLLSRKRIN